MFVSILTCFMQTGTALLILIPDLYNVLKD